MQIQELGEFGVIDLLNRMVVQRRGPSDLPAGLSFDLLVDTGDDTAAWRTKEATELFTTDTVVEEVHFTRETTPWRDLGWKCIASNVSDIAAMGGLPRFCLITLGLPPDTEVSDLEELYHGMLEIANKYGVAIVGGDLVRSPVAFITVGLTGVHQGSPMLRSNARPGDQVAVTGFLGGSGGGLRMMLGRDGDQETSNSQLRAGVIKLRGRLFVSVPPPTRACRERGPYSGWRRRGHRHGRERWAGRRSGQALPGQQPLSPAVLRPDSGALPLERGIPRGLSGAGRFMAGRTTCCCSRPPRM